MNRKQWEIAGLLFFSGLCALIYQTVWLRQFRLIFGASTFATGAVLAIFMGGLGIGSAILGKRADASARPLAYYARLELLIAAAAAISPLLLMLAAKIYFASGGSPSLGIAGATILRLALSLLVLGPATLLMGGTLPAAARAVENDDDSGRRGVALLYGVNTLGAVTGALLSTFVFLEHLGNTMTLFVAVIVNVVVALAAREMSNTMAATTEPDASIAAEEPEATPAVDARAVYAAAAIVGFAFLLMELVWYRMLGPILGGTAYMFGLVLAIALLGIGIGGAAYALLRRGAPTTAGFAITCSLEALAIAFPFALGDRLAVFAGVMRNFGVETGFGGHVVGWAIVSFVTIFPAAFFAGIQFPLLIGLLGKGREQVGRHIGLAYAWNTAGAIVGSLAGGFGLLPLLSTPTTWRGVAVLLALLALAAILAGQRPAARRAGGPPHKIAATATVIGAVLAIAFACATGPTGAWRHSGIGVGRMPALTGPNSLKQWILENRRMVRWQRDGRESSVALIALSDYAFVVNGKSDGASRGDAPTQVMLGLIATILHPNPKSGLVIGLGTGSTAGWMARVPTVQRVDAVELEPVVLDVARACAPVNAGAMSNPKVHVTIADAREVLLTSNTKYDVVASEPSNPYRAGVASLFTKDFYEVVAKRLNPGGILAQWVQSYEVDHETMRTLYATLTSVFPHVQTWTTQYGDLVLVASKTPIVVDADVLRTRLASPPYAAAVFNVWRISNVEGLLGRIIANEKFALAAADAADTINTDDRTVVEFAFARTAGDSSSIIERIARDADAMQASRPVTMRGRVDWTRVAQQRFSSSAHPSLFPMMLMQKAKQGDAKIEPMLRQVAARQPVDAAAILARLRAKQQQYDAAAQILRGAFLAYRRDPWADMKVMDDSLDLAREIAATDPRRALMLHESLSRPFSVEMHDARRQLALISVSFSAERCGARTVDAFHSVEPYPFWTDGMLALRARCYAMAGDDLAIAAQHDLEEFEAAEPASILPPKR